jgi:hypothetical protein
MLAQPPPARPPPSRHLFVLEWGADGDHPPAAEISSMVGELQRHAPDGTLVTILGPLGPQGPSRRAGWALQMDDCTQPRLGRHLLACCAGTVDFACPALRVPPWGPSGAPPLRMLAVRSSRKGRPRRPSAWSLTSCTASRRA